MILIKQTHKQGLFNVIKLKSLKLPPWKDPLRLKKKVGQEERYRMSVAQLVIFSNWWRDSFVAKDVHNGAHMDCSNHIGDSFVKYVCTYCSSKIYRVLYWKQNNKKDLIKYDRDYEITKVIKLTYLPSRGKEPIWSPFCMIVFFKEFIFEANYFPPSIFSSSKNIFFLLALMHHCFLSLLVLRCFG